MTDKSNKQRKKIAIFTTSDSTWALPTWEKTIPVLNKKYDVTGIYIFPERLAHLSEKESYIWYAKTFGIANVLLLGIYAFITKAQQLIPPASTWNSLSAKHCLQLHFAKTPNSPEVINWVRENNIDIIFIMIGNILKKDIINSPNIGIINKHAAILPSCKGLFPFFWAKLTHSPIGVTFHQVDTGIDTGKILVQEKYPHVESNVSMLRFYMDVFSTYPIQAKQAADNIVEKNYKPNPNDVTPSYHGLPNKADYIKFRNRSFKVVRIKDLLRHLYKIIMS